MKKTFITSTVAVMFLLLNSQSFAQKKENLIPEKGYWQLVTNRLSKKAVTVRFYTQNNELIYEEIVNGSKMNPDRKKVRRQLYYALQDAYQQWSVNQRISSTDLIAKRK